MALQNIIEKVLGFYLHSYHLSSKFFKFAQTIELMRPYLIAASIFLLFFSCSQRSNKEFSLSDLIPDNSAIVLKTRSFETLESDIKNNNLINSVASINLLDSFKVKLRRFDRLQVKDEAIICISDDFNLSIIGVKNQDTEPQDSLQSHTVDFFKKDLDSIFIASTSKTIINKVSTQKFEINPELKKLLKSSDSESSVSLFLNTSLTTHLIDSIYKQGNIKLIELASWIALDVYLEQNQILVNGVATVNDTLPKIIDIFKNTNPKQNKTAELTPIDSDNYISFTFDKFKAFKRKLNKLQSKTNSDSIKTDIFEYVNEIGIISNKNDIAIALFSNDILETKEALLSDQSVAESFRDIEIFKYNNKDVFKSVLEPLVNIEVDKYLILNEAVIFSNSTDFLSKIVSSYQDKTTLENSEIYKENMSFLSDESSILFVGNNNKLKLNVAKNIFDNYKDDIKKINLKNYDYSVIQLINDNGITHINGIIQKNQLKANKGSITQQFNTVLENDILNSPQIVNNHRNKQKEVVVQDVKNNLYLISNRGKVLWKKRLNGPVLGKIEQIDIYKNGRLQLIFATPKRIYVLDRNGKDVSPFPVKFNDEITQPLSVFDYDNKKNYRFLVVQGRETLMLDSKGKTVKGFSHKKANSDIVTQPKHFRLGTRDYIVFASGTKLIILNRKGKARIQVKQEFNFSENEIFLYQNYFSFTNSEGQLVQVDQKGRVNYKNLLLTKNHDLTTTSKTLVALADNSLRIKSKETELDYGNYLPPKIFYINDKIYVALCDTQSQKVYLYDSQSKLLQNFPVYGNSTPELDNLDKDRELEFIVKGESNSLILYQIN